MRAVRSIAIVAVRGDGGEKRGTKDSKEKAKPRARRAGGESPFSAILTSCPPVLAGR